MNLETVLPENLWSAVRQNYEKRDYTSSILDSFYFLSDLIREKSGLEGDGAQLVGPAFGSSSPKIRLNRMQTESEINVQKGVEQLLRGFYQAVRNPRSHEKHADNEHDAQAVIIFVGYLARQIDQAKSQFSRVDYLARVFDPDFVPKDRYAELLVSEIPTRARMDIFMDVFREVERWKHESMRPFVKALLAQLSDEEVVQVYGVVSDELKSTDSEAVIRLILASFPNSIWPHISEAARLRVENKLIRSMREGRYDVLNDRCRGGSLGTWASRMYPHFMLQADLDQVVGEKLRSETQEEKSYVFKYLFDNLHVVFSEIPPFIKRSLIKGLLAGDERFYNGLTIEPWGLDSWGDALNNAHLNFVAVEPTYDSFDDDIPF